MNLQINLIKFVDSCILDCVQLHSVMILKAKLSYELTNQLDKIRGFLHLRLRTATLRNDFESQTVLINCLLRNYLHYNLYDQADKLVLKSKRVVVVKIFKQIIVYNI